ncbi:hypothetical protein RQP46_001039 [Phenoliferia psychrophenolica]
MAAQETFTIAVCLCKGGTWSDFVQPIEIIGNLNYPILGSRTQVKIEYLAPSMEPVVGMLRENSPAIMPTTTYAAAMEAGTHYHVLWVPAGPNPQGVDEPENDIFCAPPALLEFLKASAPRARYIMSVCAGSYILAHAGLLNGKQATTNKFMFKDVVAKTPNTITWVKKARWVVDGKTWTSSGVAAGSDMALAWVAHITDDRTADFICGLMEIDRVKLPTDDPFAKVHGLV